MCENQENPYQKFQEEEVPYELRTMRGMQGIGSFRKQTYLENLESQERALLQKLADVREAKEALKRNPELINLLGKLSKVIGGF